MRPRKKSLFPYQDDLRFFLPKKKLAYRAELPEQAYIDTLLNICKEFDDTSIEVKALEQRSRNISNELANLRFPKVDIAHKPLLFELTRKIAKNIDRVVSTKSKLVFSAKVDIFSEKIIFNIKRHDKHELSLENFKKYADNIKKYFAGLVGEDNLSVMEYRLNNNNSEYEVRVNYLLLLSSLDREHKSDSVSKKYLGR